MNKRTITFRMDARKTKALDALAVWQAAHIKEGLRQAEAGKFATDKEVSAAFARGSNR